MKKEQVLERIIINPEVMVGKPIVKGTRITVQLVLKLLAQGMSTEQIIAEYPRLTQDDITACLFFAMETLDNTTFAPMPVGA